MQSQICMIRQVICNFLKKLIRAFFLGFYYFIFSNENEMTDNIVVADIELHKTRFNTSRR